MRLMCCAHHRDSVYVGPRSSCSHSLADPWPLMRHIAPCPMALMLTQFSVLICLNQSETVSLGRQAWRMLWQRTYRLHTSATALLTCIDCLRSSCVAVAVEQRVVCRARAHTHDDFVEEGYSCMIFVRLESTQLLPGLRFSGRQEAKPLSNTKLRPNILLLKVRRIPEAHLWSTQRARHPNQHCANIVAFRTAYPCSVWAVPLHNFTRGLLRCRSFWR